MDTAADDGQVGRGGPSVGYQHPQRLREGTYNLDVDRFPLLVVAAGLRCLQVGGRRLWDRYDNGDNLLFKAADFLSPGQSPLFAELLTLNDPEVSLNRRPVNGRRSETIGTDALIGGSVCR